MSTDHPDEHPAPVHAAPGPATPGPAAAGSSDVIHVDSGGWGVTYAADVAGRLHQVGLGPRGHLATVDFDPVWYPDAFPTWGGGDPYRPAALRVTHHDGTVTTRLVLDRVEEADEPDGRHTVLHCRDEVFAFRLEHHLRTHPASAVLEQWIEITHDEPGPVTLHDYDSVAPFLLVGHDAVLTQFGGSGWADEWRWSSQRLHPGTTSLTSLGGIQPHLQRSPHLLLEPAGGGSGVGSVGSVDQPGDEVIAMSIGWGGNIRFELDVRPVADPAAPRELRLRAGANPYGAEYVLDPGRRFVTPAVAWTWAADDATTSGSPGGGRAEVTRRFHRWMRARVLRDPDRLRPIVANNWEATGFDFDQERVVGLIGQAASLDVDLFLLDDGWFGTSHPRDDDTQGLGDWEPDPAKLPNGLAPLAGAAVERGIRFGIWVEPEMVNRRSDLYAEHPDWVVRDRREPREHRQQLALDPLHPEVRDFEVGVLDRTLAMSSDITYVKWDANRPVTDPGSTALGPDRQSNLWVDQVWATWQVMEEVARRHPQVELMLCASGGGRNDHATLRHFHEFWTSDNTDPVARVRMQWACSHFFPASVVAAHVTRWGERPLDFACAVALSGRFGFDLDLEALTDAEREVCRRAVAVARRTQDLVQMGDIEHLVSPVDGADRSRAAVAYHSADRRRSVVFAYQLEEPIGDPPALVLTGLDPELTYRASPMPLGDVPSGDPVVATASRLATVGLGWPLGRPCTAAIWELVAT